MDTSGWRTRAAQDERWIRKIGTNLWISHFASGWCESRMHVFMDEHGQETSGKFSGRAGSTNVAGLLQNEPGALFIQCSLFSCGFAILRPVLTHRGFPMTLHDSVRDRLRAIEALLRETEHWQETAPDSAFASDKPFCSDTRSRWSGCSGS